MYKLCVQGLSVVGERIDTDCIMFHFIVNTFPFLLVWSVNGKFAGQLTVIEDHFRVADNILQVSDLSSKCLVMFLACWGNSDLQSLGVRSFLLLPGTWNLIIYVIIKKL